MLIQLPAGCQTLLSVQAADAAGQPVPLQNVTLAWSVDNPAVASVQAAADTLTAVLAAVGKGGNANVAVTDAADAISGQAAVQVVDKPVSLSIVAGPATAVPAPAAASPAAAPPA